MNTCSIIQMTLISPQPLQKAVRKARAALVSGDAITDLSELFHALGDPTRLKIVLALSAGELCVADLAEAIGMSESAVSHQLRLLRTLRLIRAQKAGKQVYYALDDDHVGDLLSIGKHHIAELSR
jgi:DNA-binding transcriptional ArsR family regulator